MTKVNYTDYVYSVDMMNTIKLCIHNLNKKFNIVTVACDFTTNPLIKQLNSVTEQVFNINPKTISPNIHNYFDYLDKFCPNDELYVVLGYDFTDELMDSLIENEDEVIGGFIITSKNFLFTYECQEFLSYYSIVDLNIVKDGNSDSNDYKVGFSFVNKDYHDGDIAANVHIHRGDNNIIGCKLFEYQLSFLEGDMEHLQ